MYFVPDGWRILCCGVCCWRKSVVFPCSGAVVVFFIGVGIKERGDIFIGPIKYLGGDVLPRLGVLCIDRQFRLLPTRAPEIVLFEEKIV